LINIFIEQNAGEGTDVNIATIKDKTAPWPAKAYYLLDNYKFVVNVMKNMDDWK
jgi:hypothetical protein